MGKGAPANGALAAFAYTNSLGPIMWVMVGLSGIELVVVHFLLAFWSPAAAAILSVLTLLSIVWLVRLILSFRRFPMLVAPDGVTFSTGNMRSLFVPIGAIAAVRRDVRPEDVRSRDVADFALIEHPNIVVDFAAPLQRGKRTVRAATHKLDDPDGFVRALNALLQLRHPD